MRSEVQPPDVERPEPPHSHEEAPHQARGRPVYRIGGSIIGPLPPIGDPSCQTDPEEALEDTGKDSPAGAGQPTESEAEGAMNRKVLEQDAASTPQRAATPTVQRTIRFPD
jgi:hypothetical protein